MRTRGEGVKKSQNFADVIYGWSLSTVGTDGGLSRLFLLRSLQLVKRLVEVPHTLFIVSSKSSDGKGIVTLCTTLVLYTK